MPTLDFPSLHIDNEAAAALPSVAFGRLRGETDNRIANIAAKDLVYRDFTYALSVMCSPDDFDPVVRLNHALTAHELYEAAKILNANGLKADIDFDVALSFGCREDPKHLLNLMISNDRVAHFVSGYIIRWIVSRWLNSATRNQASLSKAASVIEEWAATHRVQGLKKQNIIRNIWAKYARVSHLWAALHLAQESGTDITTPFGFTAFCGTAQWLLEEGASIVPKGRRAGESVLAVDRAWVIPPAYVRRLPDGSIGTRYWNKAPEAHDIRNMAAGFGAKPV
jgi:hypothetical protein